MESTIARFPGWAPMHVFVLGADTADRARVREVLRDLRVPALTSVGPHLEIRLAVEADAGGGEAAGGDTVDGAAAGADGSARIAVVAGARPARGRHAAEPGAGAKAQPDVSDASFPEGGAPFPVEAGPTIRELSSLLRDAAPRAIILDDTDREDARTTAEDPVATRGDAGTSKSDAVASGRDEALATWASDERARSAEDAQGELPPVAAAGSPAGESVDEPLLPSVVVTDASVEEILAQSHVTGLALAHAPLGRGGYWSLLGYRAPVGEGVWLPGVSVTLTTEDAAHGVAVQVLGPDADAQWSPGELSALALEDADVHSGELAAFLDEVVGAGGVARAVAEALCAGADTAAVAAITPQAVARAMRAAPARQGGLLVEALGLPPAAARLLSGEISTEGLVDLVPSARLVEISGSVDAALEYATIALDAERSGDGLLAAYRELLVERPRVLAALLAAEAGIGALLAGTSMRAASVHRGGRANSVRGVLGGLLLADAAGHGWLATELRERLRRPRP